MKKNILFVCVENSNRSQMAQAFAMIYANEKANIFSAGSRPSGTVNPKAIIAMNEVGYDLSKHKSKSLAQIPAIVYDYVVTMGCGDECPFVRSIKRMDWNIPDPRNLEPDEFRKIREIIRTKVIELVSEL